jgi:BASS family bile acid:Na+ symporter
MAAIILPLALAFLMFAVGLRLTPGHLLATATHPRALVSGLAIQILALPALAWLIIRLFGPPPEVALGLMIISVCPGGITSNYVSLLARADVALSTAMTLVTSLAACLTIPLLLRLSGIGISPASLIRMAIAMTAVAALPLLLGMGFNVFRNEAARRLQSRLDLPSRLVFAGIVLATFWQNREALIGSATIAGPPVVVLNLAAILLALSTRFLPGITRSQASAIAVETGLQNAAIAIFICTGILGRPELAVAALIYAVVMNITALGLIALGRRQQTEPAAARRPGS